jgi:hypothetical protein
VGPNAIFTVWRRLRAVPQPVQAAAVLASLVVFLLWTPLTSRGYFAPADIMQGYEIAHVAPDGYRIKNPVLGDPVFQMYPWLSWDKAELRHHRLPVWNPYNGAGTPHLANYQSAAVSPFTAPFYAMPFRAALVAAAFLKLFLLGLFTYLFLREVRLAHLAALVGGVAFMFSAYNLLWLNWPHPGAAVLLPAGLLFAERAVQAADRRRLAAGLLGFALVIAGGLLSGHPETVFFGLVLVGPYALLRVAFAPAAWRRRLARGLQLAAAGALGAGLAAVQLIPFLEYVQRSSAYAARLHSPSGHFDLRFLPLHAFPDLLGSPLHQYQNVAITTNSNYNEATSFHIGLIVILLAIVGVASLLWRRSLLVPFFTVAAATWFAYAYDIAGVGHFLGGLPVLRLGAVTRSHIVWLFSLSCLAAAGVDLVVARAWASWRRTLLGAAAVVAAAAGLYGWAIGGERDLRSFLASLPGNSVMTAPGQIVAREHIRFVGLTFGVGVVAVVALLLAGRRPGVKLAAGAVLTAMVFAQSGFMLRHYNPTIDRRYFYPVSTAMAEINRRTAGEQTLRLAGAVLPADSNLWYRTFSPDNYDALGVKPYDTLRNRLFPLPGSPDAASPTPRAPVLRALGIRYLVTTDAHSLSGVAGLAPAWTSGPFSLYRVTGSPPRYFSPAEARAAGSDAQAVRALEQPGFDPSGTVLLHAAVPAQRSGPGTVQVLSQSPTEVRLRVRRDQPGWVVALQTHYPGWTAQVDGRSSPLVRANVAFSAVAVGAGTRDVVLRYRPASVRLGLLVSLISGVMLVAGTLLVARRGRSRLVARP